MTNKKKISVALLSIIAVASLVGCNKSGSSSVAPSSVNSQPSSEVVSSSSQEPVAEKYAVTFTGANTKAFGLPENAEAGDLITFTVVASKGYVLKDVTADNANLSGNVNDGYTFTMPKKAVAITATAVKEDEQYTVTFTGANTKAFGLPEKSLAGQNVSFYVKADAGYSVKSVNIEGVTLNGSVDDGFNFVMPEKNITVKAVAEAIPQQLSIAFEGENCYAVNLPSQAKAGDTVAFRVAAASGFVVNEVACEGADGALVKLTGSIADGYTFKMPEQAVKITANAVGAYFKAAVNTEKNDSTFVFKAADTNASAKYYADFIKGFVVDGKVSTAMSLYERAGTTIYVLVDNISIVSGVKVFANKVEAEHVTYEVKNDDGSVKESYNAYKFVMPADDVDLKVTAAGETTYTVKPSTASYYSAKTYKLVGEGDDAEPVYTTQFKGGETAYVEFNLKLGYQDQYIFSGVTIKYDYYSSYSMKTSEANNMGDKVSDGLYKFKVSTFTNYASDITMDIEYKQAKYAGKEFCTTYAYTNLYGGTKGSYFNGNITFDAAGAGKIGYNNVDIVDGSLDETAKKFVAQNRNSTSKRDVYYDGNMIWTPDSAGTNFSDVDVGVKGVSAWSEIDAVYNSDYTMNAVAYVQFYRKGTTNLIGSFLRVNGQNFLNPEIEFVNGSTEVTNSSSFKVKKNGVVLYEHNCAPVEEAPAIVGQWKYNSLRITINDDGTGVYYNGSTYNFTYSWNASTKVATLSAFAVWDDNTLTYKENNDTLVAYFDEEWHEDTFTATFTRVAD